MTAMVHNAHLHILLIPVILCAYFLRFASMLFTFRVR